MRRRVLASLVAALAVAGCAPRPPTAPDTLPDSGAIDGGLEAAGDGGPAPGVPGPLPVSLAEAFVGDAGVPMAGDGGATLVDPASSFRVEVAARIADARLSLLDAQDVVVPSDGSAEVAGTSRFALAPVARLRPGSPYTLRLDGALGRDVHDAQGRAYLPASFALRTAGDPPVSPPARKRRGVRRR